MNSTDSGSANVTNTVLTNVTRTMPVNSDDKKVIYKIYCCVLHTFLLVIVLLFILLYILDCVTIMWYHYRKHRSKEIRTGALLM